MDFLVVGALFLSLSMASYWQISGKAIFRLNRQFIAFLLFVLLVEISGYLLARSQKPNIWLFNFATYAQIIFYLLILKASFQKNRSRAVRVALVVYTIFYLLNVSLIQNFFSEFHTYSFMLGSLIVVGFCILFMYELISVETHLEQNILVQPMFWISAGLLFFYSGEFAYMGFFNYLNSQDISLSERLFDIVLILGFLMYTLFAIGFSCHKLFRTSPSS